MLGLSRVHMNLILNFCWLSKKHGQKVIVYPINISNRYKIDNNKNNNNINNNDNDNIIFRSGLSVNPVIRSLIQYNDWKVSLYREKDIACKVFLMEKWSYLFHMTVVRERLDYDWKKQLYKSIMFNLWSYWRLISVF